MRCFVWEKQHLEQMKMITRKLIKRTKKKCLQRIKINTSYTLRSIRNACIISSKRRQQFQHSIHHFNFLFRCFNSNCKINSRSSIIIIIYMSTWHTFLTENLLHKICDFSFNTALFELSLTTFDRIVDL